MTSTRALIHTYHDRQGRIHQLTNFDLEDAVRIKRELVKANGKCNFHRLRRLMIEDGINKKSLKVCPGFENLIKKYSYRYYDKNDSYSNSPISSNNLSNQISKSIHTAIGRYNYSKRESQDVARTFNRLRRHVTDTQVLRDQVSRALKHATFAFHVKHKEMPVAVGSNSLLVSFSDLHVGAIVNIPQNKYNVSVAEQRVYQYCKKVVDLVLKNEVSDLYIANLGDDVENVYMRFTQGFDTQLSMSEQIVKAIDIVTGMLVYLYNHLASFGVKIHYTGIGGNHDRLNGNKRNSIYKDNVAIIINAAVQRLAYLKFKSKYFEYIKPDGIYRTHLVINGDAIKIVHGDLDNLNQTDILGTMSVNDGRNYKLLLGGHLHRFSVMESGLNKYVVTSGSFKGPDDYSSKLGRVSSISQAAILINSNGEMTVENIELH